MIFLEGNKSIAFSNPLKTPPPEIVKQGKEAVRNYFAQLKEQQQDYLFEAKLLIVGEPGAGKTTMACKMDDADCALPEKEETTKGIAVKQYYFPLKKEDFRGFGHPEKLENRNFRINLWDFGGQEIYKATHRFFLSRRSLYALVADSRNEDTDFNYWLHIVEMFGADSPLLIVLNEKYQRKRNLDLPAMRNRFGNIKEVLDVDFAESDKTRLNRLERAVRYYVSQLPHIGSPVPARWTTVREALEKEEHNFISLQDYLNICKNSGIAKHQDAMVLSQYFHDIGVVLHFQDDDLLQKTIFLKPNWATNAVYKILDHPLLNQNSGRFSREDAKTIWHEEQYAFVHSELLRLMQKFFLCYETDSSGKYIVPERLPPAQPEYDWNKNDNLLLQYKYEYFMPKGILSQFIVQMHPYISNHGLVWKRGVVLERENTKAEIIEAYDARFIRIRIAGKNKRDFMTLISEKFDQINAQYEKMKWEKLIPCNCHECKTKEEPYFYELKDLKRRIEKNRQEVECGISYEMVNVRSLIDDVISPVMPEINPIPEKPDNPKKKVFISYATEDYGTAKRLYDDLTLKNIECWLDRESLLAGQNWRKTIPQIIQDSDYFLLLISFKSVTKKGFVQKEQKTALKILEEYPDNETFIIPARIDDTKPLDETLQNLHWADLAVSYEDGLKQILKALN
ncbi:MAG: COR domain-containing protein [Desulfococcaceae bacterium]